MATLAQHAVVLLATFNGERWLADQLRSLDGLDWSRLDVLASDDGSTDATAALLAEWQARWTKGSFTIISGPGAGFAADFRHLVLSADTGADFYAFCDQDDVWLPGKLRTAAAELGQGAGPGLYCARTMIADEQGRPVLPSQFFRRAPGFRNALVQSIAGGNTMVLNRSAFTLMREAMGRTGFVSHDWFCYQVVSGAGGTVRYCEDPQVLYRQHPGNLVGDNQGWSARLQRLGMVLAGRFAGWSDVNIEALSACRPLLTPDAQQSLEWFRRARKGSLVSRLSNLRRSGVYRQTLLGQISLYLACLLGKM